MNAPASLSDAFWAAWKDGRLLLQRCDSCGATQFYPRIICTTCGAPSPGWVDASGAGTIYSYTVVRRAPSAAFVDDVPYAIALVDLEEGPRVMGNVVAADLDGVRCGARVILSGPSPSESHAFRFELV